MTPRELFAGLAMAGMLASQKTDTLKTIADDAVVAADLLLAALADSDDSLAPESRTEFVKRFEENIFHPDFLRGLVPGDSDH